MPARRNQIAADPTASVECHRVDDRFVPLRVCDLLRCLRDEFGGGDPASGLDRVFAAMRDALDREACAMDRALADGYASFNPDRDTMPLTSDVAVRTPEGYAALRGALDRLLDKANFEPLDEFDVARVIRAANSHGLRVRLHPERIEFLSIWLRGRGRVERTRRRWQAGFRAETTTLDVFRRLVVVGRLKDDPHVLLKMFKDIPEDDVEALLPHAEVEMGLVDRLTMFSGGGVALGSTAFKVVGAISGSLLVLTKLLWILIVGFGAVAFRTFLGYRSARINRDSQRTRNLYYYNLSNNAGTIHTLVRMIVEEETKEAALAYVLLDGGGPSPDSPAALKQRVEGFLRRRFGVVVDFDVDDALDTLTRLGLWRDRTALRVVDRDEAVQRLRSLGDGRGSAGRADHADAPEVAPARPTAARG